MGIFSQVAMRRPRRNKFNLSHEKKLSLKMGNLVPTYLQEVVPGDNFRVNQQMLIRMAPMIAPIMHRIDVYTHYFFVPNRLVWSEWEDFITGGEDGTSSPVHPTIEEVTGTHGNFAVGSLADYFGLPVDQMNAVTSGQRYSALPFRAYYKIWYEYFRDQNLAPAADPKDFMSSGHETDAGKINTIIAMRKRAWQKDYFTSALPWQQRGPVVGIPIDYSDETKFVYSDGSSGTKTGNIQAAMASGEGSMTFDGTTVSDRIQVQNLDQEVFNVNNLRRSVRLQEWLEKNARGGARYVEQILSHFGVMSKDARLQRPEFLGGGKNPVQISEVLNTAGVADIDTGTGAPQGTMAGHGVGTGQNAGFKRNFTEHGFIIGITSVLPKTTYQQGIPRIFTQRDDRYKYYWPEFAQIGEQEVYKNELYFDESKPNQEDIFGYQSRYAEYKTACDSVHGEFRTTLDYWHMGRKFDSQPELNASFVQSNPTTRIFAVDEPDSEDLYLNIYNKVDALRPMPYFNVPTI